MKKLAIVLPVLFGIGACSSTSDGVSTKKKTLLTPDCVYQDAPEKSSAVVDLWRSG